MKWPINFALGLAGAVAVFTAGWRTSTHHTWTGYALALAGGLLLGIVAGRADKKAAKAAQPPPKRYACCGADFAKQHEPTCHNYTTEIEHDH